MKRKYQDTTSPRPEEEVGPEAQGPDGSPTPTSEARLPEAENQHPEEEAGPEFHAMYRTESQIGTGSFGFVILAHSTKDASQQVVVKFIRKAAVLSECWEKDTGVVCFSSSFHDPATAGA